MRWVVHREIRWGDAGVVWLREFLGGRDVSAVDWIRIDFGRGFKRGAYGCIPFGVVGRDNGLGCKFRLPFRGRCDATGNLCTGTAMGRGPSFLQVVNLLAGAVTSVADVSGNVW